MTDETTDNFWAAWHLPLEEIKPIFHRLYYDDQGNPLFYSQTDLPGNYIEIDQTTFASGPTNVRVINGKIVVIKPAVVHKLVPGDTGTACHPQDVSVVVNDTPNTKWMLK